MPPLPALSGQDVIRILFQFGWVIARQHGSHVVMVKEGSIATLSVPNHKVVAKGTLRSLIRSAGLTADELLASHRK